MMKTEGKLRYPGAWHIRETVDRGEKPERLKNVKEQYMNGATIKAFITYNCVLNQLDLIQEALEKRIKSVPMGWLRWRSASSNLHSLIADLDWTISQEKLDALSMMIKRTHCEYREGPAVSYQRSTDMVVPTKHVSALAYYAWENSCKMCVKSSCNDCPLCAALDRVVTVDRCGAMWNQIDLLKEGD